jgi:hypothetical protein
MMMMGRSVRNSQNDGRNEIKIWEMECRAHENGKDQDEYIHLHYIALHVYCCILTRTASHKMKRSL